MNALFQNRTVALLDQYASQHQGFSVKQDVLAVFAKLAKLNALDFRNFEAIVKMVFEDDPAELENIIGQFTAFLGHEVTSRLNVQKAITKEAELIRREQRELQVRNKMCNLTDHLSDLPEDQFQLLEERLKDVKNAE